jgi:uncharacterized protein YcaQ
MTVYPTSSLRAVAIRTQNLHLANGTESNPDSYSLYQLFDQLGCVQIDTLHMVQRSHYLVLWSRMGAYQPNDIDNLIFGPERKLFEGWQHAASIIPLSEYRYQMPRQTNLREHPASGYHRWLDEKVQKDYITLVRERIHREGALKVRNFDSDGRKGGTWWNWRPAKVALEYLYELGDLMITDRDNFQRVYDLTTRVLPKWVEINGPTVEERDQFWVERGAKALGVCTARQAGDYTWMKITRSKPHIEELIKNRILIPIFGRLCNGKTEELLVHRDNLFFLDQASDGVLKPSRTTFLSPFDNFFWAKARDEMLWNFHKSLEAYIPEPKRIYGYYCLSILHQDRLVGRFDPRLDRKTGRLILRAIYLEPGMGPSDELVSGIAGAMRDFMNFHKANELVIEKSQPVAFGKKLIKAI